jgi:hypothetical protein
MSTWRGDIQAGFGAFVADAELADDPPLRSDRQS